MSSTTSNFEFPLVQCPYLVRKEIFEHCCPATLVAIYRTCKTAFLLFPVLFASVSIRFHLKNPTILVKTKKGIESELPYSDLHDVYWIFAYIELEDVEIEIDEHSRSNDYSSLVDFLQSRSLNSCRLLRIFSNDNDILKLDSVQDIMKTIEAAEKKILDCVVVEYPLGFTDSPAVEITNGVFMDEEEIKAICTDAVEARVQLSKLSDKRLNVLIKNWLNGDNESLKFLEIEFRAKKAKRRLSGREIRRLLSGIDYTTGNGGYYETVHFNSIISYQIGFDLERWDGKLATVVRTNKRFIFLVWN